MSHLQSVLRVRMLYTKYSESLLRNEIFIQERDLLTPIRYDLLCPGKTCICARSITSVERAVLYA